MEFYTKGKRQTVTENCISFFCCFIYNFMCVCFVFKSPILLEIFQFKREFNLSFQKTDHTYNVFGGETKTLKWEKEEDK